MQKLWNVLKNLYRKYRETFWYLVFGALTTLVNLILFGVLFYLLHTSELAANVVAWAVSVLFAFVTNKLLVFASRELSAKRVAYELATFVAARWFTGVFDTVFLLFFTEWVFHWEPMIIKIIANVLVILMNYIFSKFIIFRKKS